MNMIFLIPLCGFFVHKVLLGHRSYHQEKKEDDDEEESSDKYKQNNNGAAAVVADDMLGAEIMERLSLFDQARFRAVCKNWLAIHQNYAAAATNKSKSLPWYVRYEYQLPVRNDKLEFRLYDPTPNLVSIQTISLTKLGFPRPPCYKDHAATPKNNWFLICIGTPKLLFFLNSRLRYYLLAYSPFTKQLIKLPSFDYPSGIWFRKITFTTVPDSPSCVFFLMGYPIVDKFVFVTYRKGDPGWTIREFPRATDFLPCRCTLVFLSGIMYIVSPYGQVASYEIDKGIFRYEFIGRDEIFTLNYDSPGKHKIFELNGELMIIYFRSREKRHASFDSQQCLKQFDWSNEIWIPVTTLGGTTLFFYEGFFSVAIIDREEMRYNRILSNKIYYFFDGGCIIYSLKDGDLVQFKSVDSNSLKDGCGDLPEYKYNCGRMRRSNIHHFFKPPGSLH